MGIGRPSEYTEEMGELICSKICDGMSLRAVCREKGMPDKQTVFRWFGKYPGFRDQYAIAKEECAEAYADELTDITDANPERDETGKIDSAWVAQQRLRVDTRKWIASKLKPKKYGDRIQQEHSGADGQPIVMTFLTGVPQPEPKNQDHA